MRNSLALFVAVGMAFIGCGGTGSTDGTGGSGSSSTTASGMGGGAATSSASSSASATSSGSSGGGGSSSASSGSGSSGSGVDGGALGPVVTILHPGSEDRKVNVSIYFHGQGVDPTDGMLTGNALVWTDNLEGQFGTGDPVNWAPTKLGAHVVTLTGTDSLKYSASDMVMFNIVP